MASAKDIAVRCAAIADDHKAEDIVVLDIHRLTFITEYFVICTGFNRRQLQTIADEICTERRKTGAHRIGMAGYDDAVWILLDYADVVVHLFDSEARELYSLEDLWTGARRVRWRSALEKLKRKDEGPGAKPD